MDEDRISSLPATLLRHILSFLYEGEAVQTCVLSKSWHHLVSTRPNFSLYDCHFREDKEKFIDFLDKSLQVYYDQKICIDELKVTMCTFNPRMVLLLEKWIPIVAVKKFHLWGYFDVPSAVFESESLEEINLERCSLSQTNSLIGNKHLKTLYLYDVCIKDETFSKFLSSCSFIEDLTLRYCKEGLRTIDLHNHRNLKSFELNNVHYGSIEIYLPSTVGSIMIRRCPNWSHHRNYFPGLTCLSLQEVPLSNGWFNSFSRNFPCLEELLLYNCDGFDEFQLSSPTIKKLHITMDKSTTNKVTIDTPSIKEFHYGANLSQSIYITTTSSSEWNSHIYLDLDASQWFRKLSGLVAAFSQSRITLELYHSGNLHKEYFSEISDVCCGGSYEQPVAMKSLSLHLDGRYYDFFYSDLVTGMFRFARPREIKQLRKEENLCRSLQMGRSEDDEGKRSFWQQDLEEVSLQVRKGTSMVWHPVQGTTNWSEYVDALPSGRDYELGFLLKWRE